MQIPNLSITLNSVLSAINSKNLISAVTSVLSPPFGIYYANGENENESALFFTNVLTFNCDGEANMSTAPVSASNNFAGSYSAFNKIAQPSKITMRVSLEGATSFSGRIPKIPSITNSRMIIYSRADLIDKLEKMRLSASPYNIETPDRVYSNYDLTKYSFPMRANSGVSLLIVDLVFQEINARMNIEMLGVDGNNKATTQAAAKPAKEVM